MDARELEKNLGEIEERLDRVRALYEQYFCGIEKVEPQVPRKDLDRRIAALRKEQIRNTATRFKFQTMIQRYNTLQQHWGRILREIENGTFKRDLARAAARFGVDDALTAVGRKRAERLAKGLEAQVARDDARKKRMRELNGEDYEEVADDDIVEDDDIDDEAPTPPPLNGAPRAEAIDLSSPAQGVPGDLASPAAQEPPRPQLRGSTGFFGNMRQPPKLATPEPAVPPAEISSLNATSDGSAARAKGGLRLGGGNPARKANSEALNRIANSLAPEAAGGEPPLGGGTREPLPPFVPQTGTREPLPPFVPQTGTREPLPPFVPQTGTREPLPPFVPQTGTREPLPPFVPQTGTREPLPHVQASRPQGPAASKPAVRQPARPAEDLSGDRLREIYSQYVQSRRDRNESTAGITFEKLADSLRTQADKLREKHAAKRVDYEVVVKDGKTLIKPIVR
jgi:hypothetical protein